MYIAAAEVLKVSGVPDDDFAFVGAGHHLLAILHPLHLVKWYFMFVLTLPNEVCASHVVPVLLIGLTSRITFIRIYI